jgi:hypothetical protein
MSRQLPTIGYLRQIKNYCAGPLNEGDWFLLRNVKIITLIAITNLF